MKASTDRTSRILDVLSATLLSFSLVALLAGTYFVVSDRQQAATCIGNLKVIGQATSMYRDDNDDFYPTTFAFYGRQVMWQQKLEAYMQSGMSDEESKGLDIQTSAGKAVEPVLGWADTGGTAWHCPYDHVGGNVSYGANAQVGGADTTLGYNWSHVRNEWWVASKKGSEIPRPAEIFWAADTNKLWQDDTQKFTAVFSDWARDDPRVKGRPGTLAEKVDWFQKFLHEDHTFDRDECDPPGLYACKGPAFRHGWKPGSPGSAGVLFCDGHAAAVKFGQLKPENVLLSISDGEGS